MKRIILAVAAFGFSIGYWVGYFACAYLSTTVP